MESREVSGEFEGFVRLPLQRMKDESGHPVVGDPVYTGGGSRRITGPHRGLAERIERATPRQALHAAQLSFKHPVSGEPLSFRAEWPEDLGNALAVAAGAERVAPDSALSYLQFFNEDG